MELVPIFRGPRVLTLGQLLRRLSCSRATVLRRLDEHGYYSSYNHSGQFLTIPEAADFDLQGLWLWRAARFSKHGTLKATVEHFVEESERGRTHEELSALLGVRAQNTLLDLVHEKKVYRERLGETYVYLNRKAHARRDQARRRVAFLKEHPKTLPTSRQIIATLLELIKDPRAKREEIVLRCQRGGVPISREVVDAIFEVHDLDKKRAL
jgi:hypothetical protein